MNDREKKVLKNIDDSEVIDFLIQLIQCKSTYPPGDSREIAKLCAEKLIQAGIEAEVVYPYSDVKSIWNDNVQNSNIPSVVAKLKGICERPILALNAHIDTVGIPDISSWKFDPFSGVIENGLIYGRGAGDDKGSVCAQIMAAIAIARSGVKLKGTLVITPVGDEEAGSYRGTKWLRDAGILDPDILIVGEQTNNQVAIAERAVIWIEVKFKGKASHGAMPWNGDNPIIKAAQFVQTVENELAPELKKRKHPYLPYATVSVTRINAGINDNQIPDLCKVTLDRRLIPGETRETVLKEIEDLIKKQIMQTAPFEYEIRITYDSGTPVNTDPKERLTQTMLACVADITGNVSNPIGYQQGSDGRLFADKKVPTVIFGPSDPAVGHIANEYVEIKQLIEATKVYALTVLRMLG